MPAELSSLLTLPVIAIALAIAVFGFRLDRRLKLPRWLAVSGVIVLGVAAFMPALFSSLAAIPASLSGAAASAPASAESALLACSGDVQVSQVDLELWDRGGDPIPDRLTGRAHLYDKQGKAFTDSGALSATGFLSLTSVACGKEYIPFVENGTGSDTSAGSSTHFGAKGESFVLGKHTKRVSLDGADWSPAQFRVRDAINLSFYPIINATSGGAANGTSFVDGEVDQGRVANDVGGAAIAVGADGRLELEVYVRTRSTNTQFGGGETFLCLDEGTQGDWGEPSVSVGGVSLSDVKSSLNANDLAASDIASCENVYRMPRVVDNNQQVVNIILPSASGVNPDDDPTIRLFAPAYYITQRTPFPEIGYGIYDDRSSRVKVGTSPALEAYLTIDIS